MIAAEVVDTHGIYLPDALLRLAELAAYASAHNSVFRRVCAVAEVGGRLRVLDLAKFEVPSAVRAAIGASDLYEDAPAADFV